MVVDARSAYELQRDNNVQRNNAWLAANGLGGGLVPPKAPPKAKRKSEEVYLFPSRASSRQSKSVVRFEQLGDDYFDQHELDSEDERQEEARAKSKRTRTQATYFKPSMCEGVARKTTARSTKPIGSAAVDRASAKPVASNKLTVLAQVASVSVAPIQFTDDASVKPYYAAGKKGQCPRCLDWFCIRRDGMLHTHHCRQVNAKQPVAPFLPAM